MRAGTSSRPQRPHEHFPSYGRYYLQVDVLEAQWHTFSSVAGSCADFERLCAAHEAAARPAALPWPSYYRRGVHLSTCRTWQAALGTLHSQCFLQQSSVSTALHTIFQLCLALCRMLSYADASLRAADTFRTQFATVRA